MEHSLGQLDATAQSARKRFAQIARPLGQSQPAEHFVLATAELGARQTVEMSLMTDVFGDRQFLVEARP